MIISKITDGLGNQLFQYAFAKSYANALGTKLKLDLSFYREMPEDFLKNRPYHLVRYGVEDPIASRWEIYKTKKTWTEPWGAWLPKKWQSEITPRIISEKTIDMESVPLDLHDGAYIRGHFLGPAYVKFTEKVLREVVFRPLPLPTEQQAMLKRIQQTESILIHVRRGDFINNHQFKIKFFSCSIEYYKQAIELMRTWIPNGEYFVFSDDIPWCRENLHFNLPAHFVDFNDEAHVYLDLPLMLHCKHFIKANSSLSWLAAWMGGAENKKVISPIVPGIPNMPQWTCIPYEPGFTQSNG